MDKEWRSLNTETQPPAKHFSCFKVVPFWGQGCAWLIKYKAGAINLVKLTWSEVDSVRRPAESRTTDFGIVILAVAMQRARSSPVGGALPSSGVPAIATSELMGTLSG